jgi:NAD+ kinase
MSQPLRILVLAHNESPRVAAAWGEVEPRLRDCRRINIRGVLTGDEPVEHLLPEVDLAVVIGGDGAILRACRRFAAQQRPILGVNVGRLGFLADLAPDEFCSHLDTIAAGRFTVASHLMFECEHVLADGTSQTYRGLNEAAIVAAGSLEMIDVQLEIDAQPVTTFSGDGLIISTPVGSTAHSLSAGGPILRQDVQAFVVTPICPHALAIRSLVDSAECTYQMTAPAAPKGVMLVIDGQIKLPFGPGDAAIVWRSDVQFQLARVPGHSFYGTLHRKLGWAGQPSYRR